MFCQFLTALCLYFKRKWILQKILFKFKVIYIRIVTKNLTMPAPLKRAQREQIIALKMRGVNVSEIERRVGVSRKTIYFWLKRWEQTGDVIAHQRANYQRRTTAEQDAAIVAAHVVYPLKTTRSTSSEFNISLDTVRRRLKEAGMKRRDSAKDPSANQTFKQGRKIMKMEASSQPKSIKEGQAEINFKTDKVFYNPVQEFNRDLSIAVLTVFAQEYKSEKLARAQQKAKNKPESVKNETVDDIEFTILEALSATGLRSIRYAKEIPNITKVIANDLSEQAVETIKENIVHNSVEELIDTSHEDASVFMYKHKQPARRFAAIDLDPYGCPSPFLDAAVQSVQEGGMLLITATDMAVLAGNSPETCYCKYGAVSLKAKCCHEMALRILLQCIESHANRYSRYIVPLVSISADFYIRVFVKVYTGALQCKKTTSKLSMVYHCTGCDQITLQPLGGFKPNPTEKNPAQTKAFLPTGPPVTEYCVHCYQRHHIGGPIWSAPIHDESFVSRLLMYVEDNAPRFGTAKRMAGVLAVLREELHEVPLYYVLDKLFGRVHLETMPMMLLRSAIMNAGYKVSYSHAAKLSIKTNAPPQLIWDIIRTWERTHPVKPAKLEADPVARHILSQEIKSVVELRERADANPLSRRDGRLRYQHNPTPAWGPAARPTHCMGEDQLPKSIRNQNKYSRGKKGDKREHSPPTDDEERKKSALPENIQPPFGFM